MGAGASDLAAPAEAPGSGLGDMPELCAAEVLLRLGAPDICRLARLNRAFRSAAAADFVWEAKLPENYGYLMGFVRGSGGEDVEGGGKRSALGKKEVYARLAKAVRFDDGKREFWLEKSTGMVCMALSSKSLVITGIDDRRYWVHMPNTESRFQSVAYLQQIWWFEVVGEIDFRFPAGTYGLYFRLHLGKPSSSRHAGRRGCGSEKNAGSGIHGWDRKPVRFQLSTSDGQNAVSRRYLDDEPGSWALYHAGDFVVAPDTEEHGHGRPVRVKFSMAQIDCTHTKGGLCVDSVLVYPRGFRTERVVDAQT
ncbi:F-box protein PP2-A13-like [Triticum dicoccoides]|uniref:F-box protein PP2-A13-like n=1 Tax=Triticum dicoccoides TaxID=85692 RepID=UPI000E7B2A33|nr:F-box protein PP2-A13-like [Triticum dicoccoides]